MTAGAGTVERKSAAELKADKAAREKIEKENAAKVAKQPTPPSTNGRGAIDAAHAALGTKPGTVPGVQSGEDGHKGSDIHDGNDGESLPDTARAMSLGFKVAGKQPTSAGLRLVGGKLDIEQQFLKGQKIVLRVEAEVGEIAFIDQHDPATGQVVGCERRHKARIVGVSVEG
jgi:hypothetical protein